MPAKPGKPAKRELSPRVGTVTQQDAANFESNLIALAGEIAALRERMRQKKLPQVEFDGGNMIRRAFKDAGKFIANFGQAVKQKELEYPGISG